MFIRRFLFFFFCFVAVEVSFSQSFCIEEAKSYFEQEKYSLAQSIFDNIYSEEYSDEAFFFSASCSKMLFASNAKYKFHAFLDEFPYSSFRDEAYIALAEIVEKSRGTSKAHAIRMSLNEIIRRQPPDLGY